jgi:Tfp pilus assembly protein PilN
MRRIDYHVTWSERRIGVALPATIPPSLRAPLAAFACAVAFVAVVWCVQHARLRAAERDGAALARRLAAAEREVAAVCAIESDVARLRALSERIASFRASGALRASEIARVGNVLPDDAWLTSLRADRGALSLEGRSARLGAVGTALAALSRLPRYGGARLIAVREDPTGPGIAYSVALDPRR